MCIDIWFQTSSVKEEGEPYNGFVKEVFFDVPWRFLIPFRGHDSPKALHIFEKDKEGGTHGKF